MRRFFHGLGCFLITAGILILLFVGYQLWGTGIYEARQQDRLQSEFREDLETTTTTTPTQATPQPVVVPPNDGDPVAIIRIPKIGVERVVVQGVSTADLRRGPGHYPLTPLAGELGNSAIAGHRTTYGAPFNRLDELVPGDEIVIESLTGTWRYLMTEQLIVSPREVGVLAPTPDATLTLTTCNPKFSARERLVVKARLDPATNPPPAEPVATEADRPRAQLDDAGPAWGTWADRRVTALWGLAALLVGLGWWLLFHRHRGWITWCAGVLPFLAVLWIFYFHLERLIPQY